MKERSKTLLPVVYPRCAGIDIAKDVHAVALPADGSGEQPVRMFGGYTRDLEELAQWLEAHRIEQVALESTGVYWIAVYEVLDACGFDVWLVNPVGLARPDRRKSDVLDCQWIQQLMSLGMLKRSHRPEDRVCELRSYVRNRRRAVCDRARCVQHMQKALQQMNLKLDSVLSDIAGRTGMAIIEAIVAGERDGQALAKMRDGRVKADEHAIAAALQGNWREEHLFSLAQALESHRHYTRQIQQLEVRIAQVAEQLSVSQHGDHDGSDGAAGLRMNAKASPKQWKVQMRSLMHELFGVDLMRVPGVGFEATLTLLSEVGSDFSAFPSASQFSQWLGLAPGTNISGGKRLTGAKARGGQALRMSAVTLRRDASELGRTHRYRCARMDPPRAVKATAHQLARIIFSMVTNGHEYSDQPLLDARQQQHRKKIARLIRQAQKHGLKILDDSGQILLPNHALAK